MNTDIYKLVNSSFYWPSKSIKSARYQVKSTHPRYSVGFSTIYNNPITTRYDDSYDKECKKERCINIRTSYR